MSKKKQINKEIRKKCERQHFMLAHPEYCYCYETLGLAPIFDPYVDDPIEYSEPIDGYPFPESKGYCQPVYFCKRCRKKISSGIVSA